MAQAPKDKITADDINAAYKQRYITAEQRNKKIRKLAGDNLEEVIGESGALFSYFKQTIKHVNDNWNDLVALADNFKSANKDNSVSGAFKDTAQYAKLAGQVMWNQVQILLAPMTAFGEVNGKIAEHYALKAGASPGLAKVINVAVDVGSGFLPMGKMAQSFVKGVQGVAPEIAAKAGAISKLGSKAGAKAGEETGEAVAARMEQIADDAITQGLKAEGVDIGRLSAGAGDIRPALKVDGVIIAGELPTGMKRGQIHADLVDKLSPELKKKFFEANDDSMRGFLDDAGNYLTREQATALRGQTTIPKLLDQPDQFIKDLRKFKAEMANVTTTKSHEMTAKEAEKLGLTIEDLKGFLGDKVSEAEMYGYLKALDPVVDSMVANAKAGLAGDTAAGDLALKTLQGFFEYSPKFRKAEVTAGRSVEILKETPPMKPITEMLRGWDPESIAKMDFDAAKKTILEDLVTLADDPGKLKAMQVGVDKSVDGVGFWEKAREAYVNLLLSRPVTQVRNFVGNGFAATTSIAERQLGGWLSIDNANGLVKGEGMAQFQGMQAALADGFKAYADAFRGVGIDEAGKLDFIPHKIGGTWGRVINVPGDMMRGMDNFFKTILQRGDIYAQALNMGRHQGLEGKALSDYVARRTMLPTQSMIDHAKDFALNQTFQNDLGTLGKAAQKLLQTGPMVMLFPFMKTPMNLAKYAWNHTPGLQFLSRSLYDDILAGGTRADMAIGRLTLSNMMGMFWYGLAQQGLVTGGGPVDPGLRRTWTATKQPYAFAGADGWWQPGQLDPATTSIWMAADFAEVMNQLDDPTAEQTAMAIGLAGVRDIVDKSYWQTVGQAVDFLSSVRSGEEPGRNATRLVTGPAVTIASGGPLATSVARAIDPVRHEARGFIDQVRSRIPGFSSDMPPLRDPWGDPFIPPQPLGGGWTGLINPLSAKGYESDKIKIEGSRLQAKVPMFPWSIGGKTVDDFDVRTALPGDPLPVDITPQQRDRWQVIYRNILRHPENGIEAVLLNSDEYKNMPWAGQRNAYMNFLAVARQGAKDALMVEDPSLARKMGEATAGKYLPMLRPEMRPQTEAQISESLDLLESLAPQERANLEQFGIMGSGEERDKQVIEMEFKRTAAPGNMGVQ